MRKGNPGQKGGEKLIKEVASPFQSVAGQNDKQQQQKPGAERCNDRYHE